MRGNASEWKGSGHGGIMDAFGVKNSDQNGFSADEDDNLIFGPITEGFRNYVKYITSAYAEGLIPDACASLTGEIETARLGGDMATVVIYVTGWEQYPASCGLGVV